MVTKKANPKSPGDKATGPVTTSDIGQTAPKGPEPGAAPAAKTKDKPEAITPSVHATELREARLMADAEKDERRAEVREVEEKAGVVPNPTIVPQGPSALRDWQVSNTASPQDTQMVVDQSELKREIRRDYHR